METLESSRVCRLCGQHSGICINIFDKKENHVKKINAVLPILVHEMDLLPKQMCHRCSYKLEEFHKFYADCLKTDMDLKSQLSWMRKREVKEHIRVPMVQIENVKIKSEPPDYDIYELDPIVENVNYISSMTFSMNNVRNNNVNTHAMSGTDQRLACDKAFANCTHCKCNYRMNNSNNTAPLSVDSTSVRSKHGLKGNLSGDLGSSCRISTLNRPINDTLRSNAKKGSTNETNVLNLDNNLDSNQVQEVKIKTEQTDDIGTRSLRPRRKSIDYLGPKRRKDRLIPNPASRYRKSDVRKNVVQPNPEPVVNGLVIDEIKKEPLEDVQSRTLRPRKFIVDYLGPKRRLPRLLGNSQDKSGSQDVGTKRYKSSGDCKGNERFSSGKPLSALISDAVDFQVKKEILADNEMSNIEQTNDPKHEGIGGSYVRNLTQFFDKETKVEIKVEENGEDDFSHCNVQGTANSATSNHLKSLLKQTTNKFKPKKVVVKPISDPNCSPKCLRSQDLRLRNGKVKNAGRTQLSIRNLKKRLLQLTTTRTAGARHLSVTENVDITKFPASLRTGDDIKHLCEKCCNTFMNKELYMLHACYYN